jgi:uncharacterized membrane protein YphA (DoxX/SURF4 family)
MNTTTNPPSARLLAFLRISIGICYFWFGLLKFFPGVSPAEDLAINTVQIMTFGLLSAKLSITLLAIWEVAVGLLLIAGFWKRAAVIAALVHMVCTFTPLIFFPDLAFTSAPHSLTIVGQYIIKNLVFVAALLLIIPLRTKPAEG